jgi:hypothetical protein
MLAVSPAAVTLPAGEMKPALEKSCGAKIVIEKSIGKMTTTTPPTAGV